MARPIIIDTDPGIDDAVAILLALASPELEVLGLVAVAGNVPLAITARNAAAILELAGRGDIPVHAGCPRPLGPDRLAAERSHGNEGLGDLVLPAPARMPRSQHGVAWLIERLRGARPRSITLCALGPLTNIATALVMDPGIAAGIAELVLMGGGSRGNVTPAAEFNIQADPQAAEIVFDSGVAITMVPLDVTLTVRSTPERVASIAALGTRCGAAAAQLLGRRRALAQPPMPMHDPCVIAYLLQPQAFAARDVNVAIETGRGVTFGMTLIDWQGVSGRPANARVLETADADALYRLLAERLAALP
ncbi:MAG: nucleoside hydrolase [Thiohalocapsa sp.]